MLSSLFLLELICILGFSYFFSANFDPGDVVCWLMGIFSVPYIGFYLYLVRARLQGFFCIRYENSIQGYATIWSDELNGLGARTLKVIGRWDQKKWSEALKRETMGFFGWIWKQLYKFELNPDGTWSFANRRFPKLVVATTVLWVLFIYGFIRFEQRFDKFAKYKTTEPLAPKLPYQE